MIDINNKIMFTKYCKIKIIMLALIGTKVYIHSSKATLNCRQERKDCPTAASGQKFPMPLLGLDGFIALDLIGYNFDVIGR